MFSFVVVAGTAGQMGEDFELRTGDLTGCIMEGQETFLRLGGKQGPRDPADRKPLTNSDCLFLPGQTLPPSSSSPPRLLSSSSPPWCFNLM